MTDRDFRREVRRALVMILVGTRAADERAFWLTVGRALPILIAAIARRYSTPSDDRRPARPSR